MTAGAGLCVEDLKVAFGGLHVIDGADLECGPGEIVGLIGPNGAGKTTMLNVISGTLTPTAGRVLLDNAELTGRPPMACARAGIARTFQNIRLFAGLTVRQNIEVAHTTPLRHRRGTDRRPTVDELLDELELGNVADRKATTLPYGLQRRVEIARAMALAPRVVLLDEPAAGMNDAESLSLIELFRGIRDRSGAGLVVIDHDLRFITGVCERIYVLAKGGIIAHGPPAEVQANPDVIEVYLGAHAAAPVSSATTAEDGNGGMT